jgi:hypothetical protein
LIAAWSLLLLYGMPGWHWQEPAVWTYAAFATFIWKVNAVIAGQALPTDRPKQHQEWFDQRRRIQVRALECTEWLAAAIVIGYALVHSVPGTLARQSVKWTAIAATFSIWALLTVTLVKGHIRLAAAGRDLRPPESALGLSGRRELRTRLLGAGLCTGLVVLVALSLLQLSR